VRPFGLASRLGDVARFLLGDEAVLGRGHAVLPDGRVSS
jgi:hypothetical protein